MTLPASPVTNKRTGGTTPHVAEAASPRCLACESDITTAGDHRSIFPERLFQPGAALETRWWPTLRNHTDTINYHLLIMLYTIALILIVLWLLGLVTGYTMGSFIHVLLVIAVIMVLLRLISGRRV